MVSTGCTSALDHLSCLELGFSVTAVGFHVKLTV